MNWYSIFYWLTVANNFKQFFIVAIAISSVMAAGGLIAFIAGRNDNDFKSTDTAKQGKKWLWYSFPFMLFFWFLYIATPSKNDTLLIIAGGSVGNFITSDTNAKQLPADVMQFLRIKLKDEMLTASDEVKKQFQIQSPKEKFMDKVKDLSKEQIIEYLQKDTTIIKN